MRSHSGKKQCSNIEHLDEQDYNYSYLDGKHMAARFGNNAYDMIPPYHKLTLQMQYFRGVMDELKSSEISSSNITESRCVD